MKWRDFPVVFFADSHRVIRGGCIVDVPEGAAKNASIGTSSSIKVQHVGFMVMFRMDTTRK